MSTRFCFVSFFCPRAVELFFMLKLLCEFNAQLMTIAERNLVLEYPRMIGIRFPHLFIMVPVVKNPSANAGYRRDVGSIPESERSPGEGHGNPLQYSCLENSMDRGAWWATVHRVTESHMTEAT